MSDNRRKLYDHPGSPLHGFPVLRRETYLIEAICFHGVGHPIPESVSHMDTCGPSGAVGTWNIHGCDGCCVGVEPTQCTCFNLRCIALHNVL